MTDLDRRSHDMFIEAIEKPPSQWPAFLDERCDSPELRERVQSLLDAHVKSGDFLADNALEAYPRLAFPFGGQVEEFRIIRLIGKGGMGQVFLAEDTVLKRLVALKIVGHVDNSDDSCGEVVQRFRREARAAARLDHPAVVQVYRTGEFEGLCYIAMEYVEGTTLEQELKSEAALESSSAPERCRKIAELLAPIADAVDQAHRSGVIHRDIKPSNILIDTDGNARLADFGVARITTEETLQRTGAIVGSCAYMSPEQARVMEVEVDHRTDIFSLGVVLYEAISLTRPFAGASWNDVLQALSVCRPAPLKDIAPHVPHDLSVICHKAIEKEVDHRYQSAAHFFADLRCFIDGMPILASPPSYWRRLKAWAGRYRRAIMLGLVGLLAAAAIGLVVAGQAERQARLAAQRALMGQLEIAEKHRGARVTVARFSDDLFLEEKVEIGNAPISTYLSPGLYRVTITDGESSIETTSLIDAGAVDIVEVNNPTEKLFESLVEIPGKKYELGSADTSYRLSTARDRQLSSFWISPTEVSNYEYRQFVLATQNESPSSWPEPYDVRLDDLPVTGITWDQAIDYCRWRGVRLPTPDEWEAAARGPDGAAFPWGDQPSDKVKRFDSPKLNLDTYLKYVQPVGSAPELATPVGIKHMLSNVQEYTAGIDVHRNGGPIVKGRSWKDGPYHRTSDLFILSSRRVRAVDRGFRIAISAKN